MTFLDKLSSLFGVGKQQSETSIAVEPTRKVEAHSNDESQMPLIVQSKLDEFPKISRIVLSNIDGLIGRIAAYPNLANWLDHTFGMYHNRPPSYYDWIDNQVRHALSSGTDFEKHIQYEIHNIARIYNRATYRIFENGLGHLSFDGGKIDIESREFSLRVEVDNKKLCLICVTSQDSKFRGVQFTLFESESYLSSFIRCHDKILITLKGHNVVWEARVNELYEIIEYRATEEIYYDFCLHSHRIGGKLLEVPNAPEQLKIFDESIEGLNQITLISSLLMVLPLRNSGVEPNVLAKLRAAGIENWQEQFNKLGKTAPEAPRRLSTLDWNRVIEIAKMPKEAGDNGGTRRGERPGSTDGTLREKITAHLKVGGKDDSGFPSP